MVDLHLEVDEGILLQATEVERYGRDEYSLDEMVLTNKYIICVYEKGNGLFAKSESITEKIPLSKIKVAGGKVQVMKVDNDDHGVGMQVLFADGTREHFIFSNNKRELPIWIGAITQAITGEQYIEPDVANKKGKKTGAGMAMFAAGIKEVADTVKQTAGEAKQQVVGSLQEAGFNVRNSETQTTSEDEVMEQPEVKTITPKFCVNCGEKLKDGAKFCYGCGSPVSVIKQEIHEQEHKVEEPKGEATTAEKLDDSENTSTRTRVEDEELTERKVVYEGKIHKCPNCGEVLGSFQATCPTCGHEVRDAKNSYSVREFAAKLEEIEHGRSTKDVVANAPAVNNIPLVQIETKTAQINDVIELDIGDRLRETFGVEVSGIDVASIEIDKSSEGYRELMSVTKDIASVTIKAEAAAKVKDIADKQRIEVENYEETLRIQREEGQYAQHKQTQSANIGAFQVEKQAEVGVAGANALGQMGANGAGEINLGGDGNGGMGFNPAAMMVSMAVGSVVGQNIAGSMNNIMGGMNQPTQGITPPPVPATAYNVAVNGQAAGPFDLTTLQKMAVSGQFNGSSLVWKAGMASWVAAETVDELKTVLTNVMPPIPTSEE